MENITGLRNRHTRMDGVECEVEQEVKMPRLFRNQGRSDNHLERIERDVASYLMPDVIQMH